MCLIVFFLFAPCRALTRWFERYEYITGIYRFLFLVARILYTHISGYRGDISSRPCNYDLSTASSEKHCL